MGVKPMTRAFYALTLILFFALVAIPLASATVPTVATAKVTGASQVTIVYNTAVNSVAGDYTNFAAGLATCTASSVSGNGTDTIVITLGVCSLSKSAAGTVDIAATVLAVDNGDAYSPNTQAVTDGQAPAFSSVLPAASTSINNVTGASDVSYTLDEAIATGAITITHNTGSADVASPHTCTLTGSALTAAAHNAFDLSGAGCVANESGLVNGANYTFVFTGQDAAGNTATPVTRSGVFFDTTTPTLSGVHIESNNANLSRAKSGNIVTVSFTASEALLATPTVTIDGQAATTTLVGALAYNATFTMTGAQATGAVTFTIDFTDRGSNAGTQVTATDDASSVTFDKTLPTLSPVHIVSTNANTSRAKTGDTVTVNFTASEALIATPTVTIAGQSALVVSTGGNGYNATYTMAGAEGQGAVAFTVDFIDLSSNAGTQVTATTDTSAVVFDSVAPTITVVLPTTNTHIKNVTSASNITYSLSEAVASGALVITRTGGAADVGSPHTCTLKGTGLASGSHTLNLIDTTNGCTVAQTLVSDANYTFVFDATDATGNAAATQTVNGVYYDAVKPTLSSVHLSSNNANNSAATTGNSIVLNFTASERLIATPVVTIAGQVATVTALGNNVYNATYVITGSEPQASAAVTVDFTDLAGNTGTQVTSTTDSSAVLVDSNGPVFNTVVLSESDMFVSATAPNNVITVLVNVSDVGSAGIAYVTVYFNNISNNGLQPVNASYNSTTGLWSANATITDVSTVSGFEQNTISLKAVDRAGNVHAGGQDSFAIVLYNMGQPQGDSCVAFGPQSTNFATVTDFNTMNLVLQIQLNGSAACAGYQLPWNNTLKSVLLMNFTNVNMSDPSTAALLAQLANAIDVELAPPNTFGTSRIYVNASLIAALSTNTSLTFYDLPFSEVPTIVKDNASRTVSSVSWAQGGFDSTYGSMTGNLTFTVSGFSGYNMTDSTVPTVSITAPAANAIMNSVTVPVTATLNGTGTQLSQIEFRLNGALVGAYNTTLGVVTLNTANCTPIAQGSERYTCAFTMTAPGAGAYALNVTAYDYGGSTPGNVGTAGVSFTVDTTTLNITVSSPSNGAYINSIGAGSAISYTLSKAVVNASITITRTGGAADSASPHTCNLTGAALTSGAHNAVNLATYCLVAPTLNSSTVYTFQFDALDNASNVATPVSVTGVTYDVVAPTAYITFSDADGKVKSGDVLLITANFDEPMTIDTSVRFSISGNNTLAATDMVRLSSTVYAYNFTVGSGNGLANILFTAGYDLAFNGIVSTPTANASFTVDNIAPFVSSIAINASGNKAKIGNIVTLRLTTDAVGHTVSAVTVNGMNVTAFTSLGGGNYSAIYTVASGDTDRAAGAVPVSVVLSDAAGNMNVAVTNVTANTIVVDATRPTVVSAQITDNNTIMIVFSEAVNVSKVHFTNLLGDLAGRNVTNTSANGSTVINLTVDGSVLAASATGTLDIAGVTDVIGNAITSISSVAVTDRGGAVNVSGDSLTSTINVTLSSSTAGAAQLPSGVTTLTLGSGNDLVLSGVSTASGGNVTANGVSQNLSTFSIGGTPTDLSAAQTIGGTSVTVSKAVTLQAGTDGQNITIVNSALSTASLTIPDGTTVLAPAAWDGAIAPPATGTSTGTAPSGFSIGNTVVSVGSSSGVLIFDAPVTVLLSGVTGDVAYRPTGSSTWTKITTTCGGTYAVPSSPSFPGECKISDGTNTKIYTYHLTSFASLQTTTTSSGGGSSHGGGGGLPWQCGEWSTCSVGGKQTRTCTLSAGSATTVETQSCTATAPSAPAPSALAPTQPEQVAPVQQPPAAASEAAQQTGTPAASEPVVTGLDTANEPPAKGWWQTVGLVVIVALAVVTTVVAVRARRKK